MSVSNSASNTVRRGFIMKPALEKFRSSVAWDAGIARTRCATFFISGKSSLFFQKDMMSNPSVKAK